MRKTARIAVKTLTATWRSVISASIPKSRRPSQRTWEPTPMMTPVPIPKKMTFLTLSDASLAKATLPLVSGVTIV
jgi:hypothetical protein